jgi:hypothetical protein
MQATSLVKAGGKPSRPEIWDCPGLVMTPLLWDLATDCWKLETEGARPTAKDLLDRLQRR